MNYNKEYEFEYDNDDDYRVSLLNAYNILLENEENLDKAINKLSLKQDVMYSTVMKNNIFRSMMEEIHEKNTNIIVKSLSLDFLFTYLHNYDYFIDLHVILRALLEEDDNLHKLCELFKNKIINNI